MHIFCQNLQFSAFFVVLGFFCRFLVTRLLFSSYLWRSLFNTRNSLRLFQSQSIIHTSLLLPRTIAFYIKLIFIKSFDWLARLAVGLRHGVPPQGPTLLFAFARGAVCEDGQVMLPLHLGFHNGCEGAVVDLLLVAYPQSVNARGRKGRTPIVVAQ